jgi:hypothetical protein
MAVPASAFALGAAGQQTPVHLSVSPRHVRYGRPLTLSGTASPADAGGVVEVEFAPAGSSRWELLRSARVQPDGRFRVSTAVPHTGFLQVQGSPDPELVTVAAEMRVRRRAANVLGGQPVDVRGELLPGLAGRSVVLQGFDGGRWDRLASARTRSGGRFRLRYVPGGTGQERLRVKFAGDRLNTRSIAPAGRLTVFRETVASWYDDSGATACGFHAGYGVASPSLPCGTTVIFRYGSRSVTATVDDRGPFVGSRDWDLNQNTAGALDFDGVDTVWSSK